jgi:hypothetical protein
MTNNERNFKIIEALKQQTQEHLNDPVKLNDWVLRVYGPKYREIIGKEKQDMLLILTLIEPYKSSNNQRTSTDFYQYLGKEYEVTFMENEDTIMLVKE